MSQTQQIFAEGYTVADAVRAAAKELGVEPHMIKYELDLSHFKNAAGRSRPVDTVKIKASALSAERFVGGQKAKEWLEGLVEIMRLKVDITMALGKSENSAVLTIKGKGSKRLSLIEEALTTLIAAVLDKDGLGWTVSLSFPEHQESRGGRDDGERRGRGRDRDDRRGRGRDRDDRRGRGRDRDDRRGRGGRGRDRGGDAEREQELRKLARRLAEKAAEEGKEITIRRSLNSYERRIVHMEVADIAGVESESHTRDDGDRTVVLKPAAAEGADAE